MRTALNTIAELLGVTPVMHETSSARGRRVVETLLYCDWASLRYQHTLALRTLLAERYKPATANKMLAALRRVLLEARRLGLMSPDDYAQAADIGAIKGSSLAAWPRAVAGRALRTDGDLQRRSDAGRPARRRADRAAQSRRPAPQRSGRARPGRLCAGHGRNDRAEWQGSQRSHDLPGWRRLPPRSRIG